MEDPFCHSRPHLPKHSFSAMDDRDFHNLLHALEAFIDHRLDAAFERNATRLTAPDLDNEPGEASPAYISKKAAARLLGCSVSSIDNWRRAGHLPVHKLPGQKAVRFLKSDVLSLAEQTAKNRR